MTTENIDPLESIGGSAVRHLYRGGCPDSIEGSTKRDPECPACDQLTIIQRFMVDGAFRNSQKESPSATELTTLDRMVNAFCDSYAGRGFAFPDPTRVRMALEAALSAAPPAAEPDPEIKGFLDGVWEKTQKPAETPLTAEQLQMAIDAGAELAKIESTIAQLKIAHGNAAVESSGDWSSAQSSESFFSSATFKTLNRRRTELRKHLLDLG